MQNLDFHKKSSYVYYLVEFINESRRSILGTLKIVYFLSIGLSLIQVTTLYATGQVMLLLSEFPTGAFADSFGRKKSIIFSFLLLTISFTLTFFTTNYYWLIALNSLTMLGWTFQSGTHDAWIIDTLGLGKQPDLNGNDINERSRTNIFSTRFIVGKIGWVIGGIVGSIIAYFNIQFIWLALALFNLIGFLLLLKYMEERGFTPERFSFKKMFHEIKKQSKDAIVYSYKHNILSVLLLIILFKGFPLSLFEVSWPIFFKDILNIPVYYFGIIVSVSTFFAVFGAYISKKMSYRKGIPAALFLFYLIFVISALGLGIASLVSVAIGAFCFFQVGEGGTRPVGQSALHKYIPSNQRASILSLRSMLSGGGSMLGYLVAEPIISFFGPQHSMFVVALMILVIGGVHATTLKKPES
ncbi:MAG: MFS transporter [archaeon]|nr:MFS transporter [archaeon]